MKCLSIQMPWAWLIVLGLKDVENRSWAHRHRGALLIHAGKKFDEEGAVWLSQNLGELAPGKEERIRAAIEESREYCGGIVGRVEMVDVVAQSKSPWFFGPYGFVFANAQLLPFRAMPGKLGIFDVQVVAP